MSLLHPERPKRHRVKRKKPKLLKLPSKMGPRAQLNSDQILERQIKVRELRIDKGMTWFDIGKALGIDQSTAYRDAQVIRKMKFEGMIEQEEAVIDEHEARYDQIIARWLTLALAENIAVQEIRQKGDETHVIALSAWEAAKGATETLLKAMRQREQLHGVHDPKKPAAPSSEEIGSTVDAVLTALQKHFRPAPKIIEAEVVDSIPLEITKG